MPLATCSDRRVRPHPVVPSAPDKASGRSAVPVGGVTTHQHYCGKFILDERVREAAATREQALEPGIAGTAAASRPDNRRTGGLPLACGGSAQTATPEQQAVITSPTSGIKVTSVISSASPGDSHANGQLAFVAGAASTSASVEVVSITLVDATSGSVVDTLEASSPQVWNGGGYVPWNQQVTPGGDLRASYQLSAPAWSSIDPGGKTPTRGRSSSASRGASTASTCSCSPPI